MASRRVPRTVGLQAVFQGQRNPAMEGWAQWNAPLPLMPLVVLYPWFPGINNTDEKGKLILEFLFSCAMHRKIRTVRMSVPL